MGAPIINPAGVFRELRRSDMDLVSWLCTERPRDPSITIDAGIAVFSGDALDLLGPDVPYRAALVAAIESLSPLARRELLALVWLGRGDFATLADAMAHAREDSAEATANYLAGKSRALPKYLRRGREACHGRAAEPVEP